MFISRHWIFFRFMLPALAWCCGEIPHLLWPKSELWLMLGAVFFLIAPMFNFAMSLAERPQYEPEKQGKKYRKCVAVWQTSEILALIVLGFTEVGAAATFIDPHPDQWFDILIVGLLFFGPYAALVLLARNRLRRCYEILAEDIVSGQNQPIVDGA